MNTDKPKIKNTLLALVGSAVRVSIDVDPRLLLTAAYNNGVLPVVHSRLMKVCANTPYSAVIKGSTARVAAISVRNEFLASRAIYVLGLLEKQSVRAVLFKGPEIALRAYGGLGMRQFDDIDLIIPAGDILKARSILLSVGFTDKHVLSEKEMHHQIKYGWGLSMVSAAGDYIVELDSGILHHYQSLKGLDEPAIWSRAVEHNINGTKVRVLPPELELMMLCVHGTKHCWERLVWVSDIAGLLSRTDIDFGKLLNVARQCSCLTSVLVGIELVRKISGITVPSEVAGLIEKSRRALDLAEWAIADLVGCDDLPLRVEAGFNLRCRENPGDRLRYCFRSMFDPSIADFRFWNINERLSWLYYFIRPVRLAIRNIGMVGR